MIIEYTDAHIHRIRLDFSDLKEVPELRTVKSMADVITNESKLLDAALLVIEEVRSNTRTYSVLAYQNGKIWLNGYEK